MNQKLHDSVMFNTIARNLRNSGCFVLAEHVKLFYETDPLYLKQQILEKELEVIFIAYLNFFAFSSNYRHLTVFDDFMAEACNRLRRLGGNFDILCPNDVDGIFRRKYFLPRDIDYPGICLFLAVLLSSLENVYLKASSQNETYAIKLNLDEIVKFKRNLGV